MNEDFIHHVHAVRVICIAMGFHLEDRTSSQVLVRPMSSFLESNLCENVHFDPSIYTDREVETQQAKLGISEF